MVKPPLENKSIDKQQLRQIPCFQKEQLLGIFPSAGRLTISVGADSFPSGDGTFGGDFDFRFTILPGDANRDNEVDGLDYVIWAMNYQSGTTFEEGDFTGDGEIDIGDFVQWANNFGATAGVGSGQAASASAVPVPMIRWNVIGCARASGQEIASNAQTATAKIAGLIVGVLSFGQALQTWRRF